MFPWLTFGFVALSEGDFSFSRGERGFAEMPSRVGSLGGARK
jgi:hypothetical protein